MEKRGIYRKGSAGHARYVNSYSVYRQKFKKWRAPLSIMLGLLFIFGTVPLVGEKLHTSVLTEENLRAQSVSCQEEIEKAKPALESALQALNQFVKEKASLKERLNKVSESVASVMKSCLL